MATQTATPKEVVLNANIQTTTVTQSANELLGKKEQKLYYLVIKTATETMTINVGEKTHDAVVKLTGGKK